MPTTPPRLDMSRAASNDFVPATGWRLFLPLYDLLVATFAGEKKLKQHICDILQPPPRARLLDSGCGSGTLALALAAQHQPEQVIGLDADPAMLAQAQRKQRLSGRANQAEPAAKTAIKPSTDTCIQWIGGNVTQLPFDDCEFDVVYSTLVLHHLLEPEKYAALAECRRVLKPSGHLVLADFMQQASRPAQLLFQTVRLIDGWECTALHTSADWSNLLRHAGYHDPQLTRTQSTCLGTVRVYVARKP